MSWHDQHAHAFVATVPSVRAEIAIKVPDSGLSSTEDKLFHL